MTKLANINRSVNRNSLYEIILHFHATVDILTEHGSRRSCMISASEALSLILQSIPTLPTETVSLKESLGRVLASEVVAEADIPPFESTSMDGFAVRSSDTVNATPETPARLTCPHEVAAGQVSTELLKSGEAWSIMTGAMLPNGADAVIEKELVQVHAGEVHVSAPVARGRNIRARGEDIRHGSAVLRQGERLGPAHLGVLASLGRTRATVSSRPRVGILTTGSELVPPGQPLTRGKIHDSNGTTLWGLVKVSGCVPEDLGAATDQPGDLAERIRQGLSRDVLITSGGVSVGKHDLVLKTVKELGVELRFWKVNIKPGMPLAFGLHKKGVHDRAVPVFCLPGNPVSTTVTYLQFVKPALKRMQGTVETGGTLHLQAQLEEDVIKNDGKRHFVRGVVHWKDGELLVRTTGSQSSAVLTSLVHANCLVHLPEESAGCRAGDRVEIELL